MVARRDDLRYTEWVDDHTTQAVCLGIEPRFGRKPLTYAALDDERNLLALGQGSLADVLAFVGGQASAFIGVNAPSQLNQGLMQQPEARPQSSLLPPGDRWNNARRVEYDLHNRGISLPRTPASLSACPRWMQRGFHFYHQLQKMDYRAFPAGDFARVWLEVPAEAAFHALLRQKPLPANTIESRLQRQLILYEHDLPLPDPMRFFEEVTRRRLLQGILPEGLYAPAELNALVCAYTAWLAAYRPQQIDRLGAPEEGEIVLPARSHP